MSFLEGELTVDDFESAAKPPNKFVLWLREAGLLPPKPVFTYEQTVPVREQPETPPVEQ